VAKRRVLILDNLVSHGTLGMQSRNEAKALLIDCVLRLSFLLLPTPIGCCCRLLIFDFLVEEEVELEANLAVVDVLLESLESK